VHRGVFRNRMTRDEMLDAEAMATIERDWRACCKRAASRSSTPRRFKHFRYARYLAKLRRA
jgi:hypothetical protein